MSRVRPLALRLPPLLLLALITLASAWLGRWLAGEVTRALDGVRQALSELEGGDLQAAGLAAGDSVHPGLREPGEVLNALAGALDGLRAQRTAVRDAALRRRSAERAKARFLAHLSHELKSPLNSILGFSEVLLAGIDGPLPPRQAQRIALIWRSGSGLLRFILALLDLARLEVPLDRRLAADPTRPSGLSPSAMTGRQLHRAIADQIHEDPSGALQVRCVDATGGQGQAWIDSAHTPRALGLLCGPLLDALDAGTLAITLTADGDGLSVRVAVEAAEAEPTERARLLSQLAEPVTRQADDLSDRFNAAGAMVLLVTWVVEAQGGQLIRDDALGWPGFRVTLPSGPPSGASPADA